MICDEPLSRSGFSRKGFGGKLSGRGIPTCVFTHECHWAWFCYCPR
jgi:hypothetical protein